jgi:hypothetical protein
MYQDQDARRSHNVKIENNSLGMVEEFKYLGIIFSNEDFF